MLRNEDGMAAHRRLFAIFRGLGGGQALLHEASRMVQDHLHALGGKIGPLFWPQLEAASECGARERSEQGIVISHAIPI